RFTSSGWNRPPAARAWAPCWWAGASGRRSNLARIRPGSIHSTGRPKPSTPRAATAVLPGWRITRSGMSGCSCGKHGPPRQRATHRAEAWRSRASAPPQAPVAVSGLANTARRYGNSGQGVPTCHAGYFCHGCGLDDGIFVQPRYGLPAIRADVRGDPRRPANRAVTFLTQRTLHTKNLLSLSYSAEHLAALDAALRVVVEEHDD